MILLEAALSKSYPQDLSKIQRLCGKAILCCESIRPRLNTYTKGISSEEIAIVEQKINKIVQKKSEVEKQWDCELRGNLNPQEISCYVNFKKICQKALLSNASNPESLDYEINNAIIDHTVKQINSFKTEVDNEIYNYYHPFNELTSCSIQ